MKNRYRLLIVTLVLALGGAAYVASDAGAAVNKTGTAVEKDCVGWGQPAADRVALANQAIEDGWNTRNVDAIMKFVTWDVSYFAVRTGEYKTGRENMRADYVAIFSSLPAGTTMDVQVVNVTSLEPGLVHADVRATVTYFNSDGTVSKTQRFVSSNVWQLGCVPQAKTVRDYPAL
jgi:uncharacterized protein (TIGR02246 family)